MIIQFLDNSHSNCNIGDVTQTYLIDGFRNQEPRHRHRAETFGGKQYGCLLFQMQKQAGDILPTIITVYSDKSFSFITKKPPASQLLKKAAGLKKGSQTPGSSECGQISISKIREIAAVKMEDLNAYDEDEAVRIISGSARSMGLKVVD